MINLNPKEKYYHSSCDDQNTCLNIKKLPDRDIPHCSREYYIICRKNYTIYIFENQKRESHFLNSCRVLTNKLRISYCINPWYYFSYILIFILHFENVICPYISLAEFGKIIIYLTNFIQDRLDSFLFVNPLLLSIFYCLHWMSGWKYPAVFLNIFSSLSSVKLNNLINESHGVR